jgi:hypothetical protein
MTDYGGGLSAGVRRINEYERRNCQSQHQKDKSLFASKKVKPTKMKKRKGLPRATNERQASV